MNKTKTALLALLAAAPFVIYLIVTEVRMTRLEIQMEQTQADASETQRQFRDLLKNMINALLYTNRPAQWPTNK